MKKVYSSDGIKTVTCIAVHIKFSKEIAYWDKDGYYQNPKFSEFWDRVNTNPKYHHFRFDTKKRDNLWEVYYYNEHCQDLAEDGTLVSNAVRYLVSPCSDRCILIDPEMSAILIHDPSEYPTTHEAGLQDLATLCADCAKYCGGTVEFTYSSSQHRFIWDGSQQKSVTLGKGIRKWRIRDVQRTKTAPEVNHVWSENPKSKKQ